MKKSFIIYPLFVLFTLFTFICVLYSTSLWNDEYDIYKLNIKQGDILRLVFDEKMVFKYKQEQKLSKFEDVKGEQAKGELFSFFPDATVSQKDENKTQNTYNLQSDSSFIIPVKVMEIEGDNIKIRGKKSVLIEGEILNLEIDGECGKRFVSPDYTIDSTDVYGIKFSVGGESQFLAGDMISENDLIFETNYSELMTNMIIDTNNNTTNEAVSTNMDSMKIELKGISESSKQKIIVDYLNFILKTLF